MDMQIDLASVWCLCCHLVSFYDYDYVLWAFSGLSEALTSVKAAVMKPLPLLRRLSDPKVVSLTVNESLCSPECGLVANHSSRKNCLSDGEYVFGM